jgi:hypothetical protein
MEFHSNKKFKDSNAYRLSELKPAGTQLILEPKTELIKLLKLTLFDLTLKQVLTIKKAQLKSHPRDPHFREYVVVETGKNFAKYQPNKFEEYFTDLIDEDNYFKLKPYIRAIFKNIPSEYKYKKEVIRDLKLKSYFKSDLISSIFSWLKSNFKGKKLKNELQEYLNEADNQIVSLIEDKPEKALQLILFLQGNIFLLKTLKFELLEKLKLTPPTQSKNEDDFLVDWFWIDFMYDPELSFSDLFSDISEMFDSIDDYFDFDSGGDWGGDYDFDFD